MGSEKQVHWVSKPTSHKPTESWVARFTRSAYANVVTKFTGATKMRGHSLRVLSSCALSLLLVLATRPASAESVEVVRMASGLGFSTFDPVLATPPTVDYLRPVYDTLVVRRGIDTFVPGLAASWEYSEGNKVLTLMLRKESALPMVRSSTARRSKLTSSAGKQPGEVHGRRSMGLLTP